MHMDYRKMAELAADPAAVRRIARSLIKHFGDQLNDDALDFLIKLKKFGRREGFDFLTIPQREFLYSLMARGRSRRQIFGGYRAYTLLTELWAIHLDLYEDDEEFVKEMLELGPDVALSDGQWRYVLHLCRANDIINHWVAA